jgi:hypothetical protein
MLDLSQKRVSDKFNKLTTTCSDALISATSQDFIKFWGNFFVFVLLVLIEIHKDLKLFEFIEKL